MLSKFLEQDALESILKTVIDLEETRLVAEYQRASKNPEIIRQIHLDKAHFIEKISTIKKDTGAILQAQDANGMEQAKISEKDTPRSS